MLRLSSAGKMNKTMVGVANKPLIGGLANPFGSITHTSTKFQKPGQSLSGYKPSIKQVSAGRIGFFLNPSYMRIIYIMLNHIDAVTLLKCLTHTKPRPLVNVCPQSPLNKGDCYEYRKYFQPIH